MKLFRNVMLFDGTGSGLRPAEVLVEGNRIRKVAGQRRKRRDHEVRDSRWRR